MKKIGILFGVENRFPIPLVERINAKNSSGIQARFMPHCGQRQLDYASSAFKVMPISETFSEGI
jgi:hypothetical protein